MTRQRLLFVALASTIMIGAACAPMPDPGPGPDPDPDPAPVVTGVDPATGPEAGGTEVTITGEALGGATEVTFGDEAAAFDEVSDTELSATAPPGTGTVDVLVTTPAGTSEPDAAAVFTYLEPDPDPGPAPGTCFESAGEGADFLYFGPLSASPNIAQLTSNDGTCSGSTFFAATVVVADDQASADAACETVSPGFGPAFSATGFLVGVQDDLYVCSNSVQAPAPDPGTCLGTLFALGDLRFDGPELVAGNTATLTSSDGSCDGDPTGIALTTVFDTSNDDANDACESISPGSGPAFFAFPPFTYICNNSFVYPVDPEPAPGTCFDSAINDVRYDGPSTGSPNASIFSSNDGTCSGTGFDATLVQASTQAVAESACAGFGFGSAGAIWLSAVGLPSGWWLCQSPL